MIDRYRQSALTGRRKPVNGWRRSLVPLLRSSSQRWVAWRCKMSHYVRTYRCDLYRYVQWDTSVNNTVTILILIYHTCINNVVSDNVRSDSVRRQNEIRNLHKLLHDKYQALKKRENECVKWHVSGISPSKCDSASEIMGTIISTLIIDE